MSNGFLLSDYRPQRLCAMIHMTENLCLPDFVMSFCGFSRPSEVLTIYELIIHLNIVGIRVELLAASNYR